MDTTYLISFFTVLAFFIFIITTISKAQNNKKVKELHYKSMPINKSRTIIWK